MIYDIHPWSSEHILVVNDIIELKPENREKIYELYDIESDEHESFKAQDVEKMLNANNNIPKYAVSISRYGKLKRNKFSPDSFNRLKAISFSDIYVTDSTKFQIDGLYAFDIVKYGLTFNIHSYSPEDFEFLGICTSKKISL